MISRSAGEDGRRIVEVARRIASPARIVHLLRGTAGGMRTIDEHHWRAVVGSFADFVPLVIVNTTLDEEASSYVLEEGELLLNPLRRWKAIFVPDVEGRTPLIRVLGLDPARNPSLRVVPMDRLEEEMARHLADWVTRMTSPG